MCALARCSSTRLSAFQLLSAHELGEDIGQNESFLPFISGYFLTHQCQPLLKSIYLLTRTEGRFKLEVAVSNLCVDDDVEDENLSPECLGYDNALSCFRGFYARLPTQLDDSILLRAELTDSLGQLWSFSERHKFMCRVTGLEVLVEGVDKDHHEDKTSETVSNSNIPAIEPSYSVPGPMLPPSHASQDARLTLLDYDHPKIKEFLAETRQYVSTFTLLFIYF